MKRKTKKSTNTKMKTKKKRMKKMMMKKKEKKKKKKKTHITELNQTFNSLLVIVKGFHLKKGFEKVVMQQEC